MAGLGAVRNEFGKYAGVLEKVQKKLHEASNTVDDAARRTRVLEKTLRKVDSGEETPAGVLPRLDEDELDHIFTHVATR